MQCRNEHAITLPQYIYITYQPHVQACEGSFPDGGYFLPNSLRSTGEFEKGDRYEVTLPWEEFHPILPSHVL